jgi:8-oxo-dGTP diphosphatase
MKSIEVVAAIIYNNEEVLATQRGYGEFMGMWEFPGGKVEFGESHEEALRREISEELNLDISVGRKLTYVSFDYPAFHLNLHCYLCGIQGGKLELNEHLAYKWVRTSELAELNWLPADVEVIRMLQDLLG